MVQLPTGTPPRAQLRTESFYGLDTRAESGLTNGYAPEAYNCAAEDGTLTHAAGFAELKVPMADGMAPTGILALGHPVNRIGYYKVISYGSVKEYLIAVTDAGAVYYMQINAATRRWTKAFIAGADNYDMSDCSMVRFRQGTEDSMLFFSKNDTPMRLYDGDGYYLPVSAPKAPSACVHYERVFACGMEGEPYNVRFSASMDCTDWTGEDAGYITVLSEKGFLIKVISFADAVYVFHQYGISRLDAHARQTSFSVTGVWNTASEILPGSIVNCGTRIIFATRKGLYQFNGASITRICRQADGLWSKLYHFDKAQGCWHNQTYCLFCNTHLKDPGTVSGWNTLIRYHLDGGTLDVSVDFHAVAAAPISYPGYEGLVLSQGEDGELFEYGGVLGGAFWRSPTSDFGRADVTKLVTDVYVTAAGTGDLTVQICADGEETEYTLPLTAEMAVRRVRTFGRGRRIGIGFEKTSGALRIENFQVKMDYGKDGV